MERDTQRQLTAQIQTNQRVHTKNDGIENIKNSRLL